MKTTTVSKTSVGEHAAALNRRALARRTVQLIGALAFNAVLLLAGARLTRIAGQDLCFLLLPPMVASAGAGCAFLVLNWMAHRPAAQAVADLPRGHAHVAFDR